MNKIDLYNQISKEIVKNYNLYLHPEDVKILKTLEVPAHYTIGHVVDISIANKLHQVALQLKELDPSLILNEPKNYHITLFWKGLDSGLEKKIPEIENIINSTRFEFRIEELLFGPLGVSVKFYPKNECFVEARKKLYELTNTPILIDERFVTTWVSIAAYAQVPTDSVKNFVRENSLVNFGDYIADNFTLYISTNKGLVSPKMIKIFECAK
jgi:2'-5' RNA ligase